MYVDLLYLPLYEGFSQEINLTHMQEVSPAAAEAHSAPFCGRVRRQQLARREQPGSRSGAGPGRAEPRRTPAPGSAAPGASRAPSGDSPALDLGWAPSGG